MREWFFEDDGVSLHRAKEMKEALNAVCVTISGANLHWPVNSTDRTLIEQMWWMGKGSINREYCNTPEELSVHAQVVLAAITIWSVNGLVGSSSNRLCIVFALSGKCRNGHCDVMRDLRPGGRISEGIAHAREASAECLQGSIEESRELCSREISLGFMASGLPNRFP
jgi:hypothetical protein